MSFAALIVDDVKPKDPNEKALAKALVLVVLLTSCA